MEGRYCLMFLTALCLSVEPGTASKERTQADRLCCAASRSAEPPKSCGSCGPGQCCKDKRCSQCAPLLQCPEGKELYCTGTIEYRYFCKRCPDGTYSENNNSCCNPWTDCEKMGQWTVQQGNETHNAVCGPKPSAILVEPVSTNNLTYWIPLGGFTTFLIILIAASILMLAVMILCLITHIIIHRAKLRVVEEPKSVHPLNLPESQLDLEDTFSCQFPEEEHGDKILGGNFSLTSVVH
ncbi:tumor necrosis factor receptor superfamily member 18 [Python bivittatus]|uniref:Tumor necrosis factor receptor superfamily member 18 n=1 Tax=Python bivittatus TaxID=176946 RepID=A0A9F5IYA6_PYTBI|nr:tumor necrosis factor receptor superfamily member 18 [Python bivittatus]